jgi:hypothetical protein
MIIVSDTSPLCNLQLVDSLWLLRELYGIVIIPQKKNASLVTWGGFWVGGAIALPIISCWGRLLSAFRIKIAREQQILLAQNACHKRVPPKYFAVA